jgi:hypothetical protein
MDDCCNWSLSSFLNRILADDGTDSTDAQLGSIPGIPGTLNRNLYPGNIAAVDEIGFNLRKSFMVKDSMFDP